jgi:hypothetical protein
VFRQASRDLERVQLAWVRCVPLSRWWEGAGARRTALGPTPTAVALGATPHSRSLRDPLALVAFGFTFVELDVAR